MDFPTQLLQALSFFAFSIGITAIFIRLIKLGGYFRN